MTSSAIDRWQFPAATCHEHQIVHVNQHFLRLLGHPDSQSVDRQPWSSVIVDGRYPEMADWINRLSQDNAACPVMRTSLQSANDAPVEVSITRVRSADDEPGNWTAVLDAGDTAFREFQASAARRAAQSLQMIEFGELAVSLLHDLGQPITAVQAASEIIETDVTALSVPDEFRRLIHIIARSGRELSKQHTIIRNFVRHRRLSTQIASVQQLLSESVDLVRGFASERQIRLELAVDESLPPIPLDWGILQLGFISLLNQSLRLVELTADADKRILIRHSSANDGQEVIFEFHYPSQDVSISEERFETVQHVAALHDGRMTMESPAENVARCRLLLP